MARRSGFFAELQRQAEAAAREQARRARELERSQAAALRAAERDRKAEERLAAQIARASAAEAKRLAKEAKEAHVAGMEADVASRNADLTRAYEQIDGLLAATLNVDDCIDLTTLHVVAEHPPFDRADLETPTPQPDPVSDPPQPQYVEPPAPKGLSGVFGKKKHEEAVAAASQAHQQAMSEWQSAVTKTEEYRQAAAVWHAEMEELRLASLEAERARYAEECSQRVASVEEHNAALDALAANLGYGTKDAIEEYVALVFSRSAYPEAFPVEHDFEFDPENAELRLTTLVPGPDKMPTVAAYKYTKSSDEITSTTLSQKARKDRYNDAVSQVALRALHEVFEADRRGLIRTISLEVATETIDPATGLPTRVLFIAVAAERERFMQMDLANVVPLATLNHLGAAMSKNPFDLAAANAAGVRQS